MFNRSEFPPGTNELLPEWNEFYPRTNQLLSEWNEFHSETNQLHAGSNSLHVQWNRFLLNTRSLPRALRSFDVLLNLPRLDGAPRPGCARLPRSFFFLLFLLFVVMRLDAEEHDRA